jgi:hypothetical protein
LFQAFSDGAPESTGQVCARSLSAPRSPARLATLRFSAPLHGAPGPLLPERLTGGTSFRFGRIFFGALIHVGCQFV